MSGRRSEAQKAGLAIAVALLIGLTAVPARAAVAERGVNYGGSTSAGDPVVIRLSAGGTRVATVSEEVEVVCSGRTRLTLLTKVAAGLAIGAAGAFSGAHASGGALDDGRTVRATTTWKGRVTGRRLTGATSFHAILLDAQGATSETCDTSSTFAAAAAKGRVFAGYTSQGAPVVMELGARGRSVHHVHIGWRSRCRSSESFQVGDTLNELPVVAGGFGDEFTQPYTEIGGGQSTYIYRLRGRITAGRAVGSLRVAIAETAADGSRPIGCDTGTVGFTAATG